MTQTIVLNKQILAKLLKGVNIFCLINFCDKLKQTTIFSNPAFCCCLFCQCLWLKLLLSLFFFFCTKAFLNFDKTEDSEKEHFDHEI